MQTDPDIIDSVDTGFDSLDYGYANTASSRRNTQVLGERDLWCAVIVQAFMDIGALTPAQSMRRVGLPEEKNRCFQDALRWLLWDRKDFIRICDLAGVSPQVIRRAAYLFYGRSQLALGATVTADESASPCKFG